MQQLSFQSYLQAHTLKYLNRICPLEIYRTKAVPALSHRNVFAGKNSNSNVTPITIKYIKRCDALLTRFRIRNITTLWEQMMNHFI